MRVIDGKFGKPKNEKAKGQDALQAFSDMVTQIEDENDVLCEVAIVLLSPFGLTLGGNVKDPDGMNYMMDIAKRAIMDAAFGYGEYEDETEH